MPENLPFVNDIYILQLRRTIYCNAHAQQNELSVMADTKKISQTQGRNSRKSLIRLRIFLRQRKSRHENEVAKSNQAGSNHRA